MNSEVKALLERTGYKASYMTASSKEDIYIVFNFDDIRGASFSDDEPEYDLYSLQVHLFHPKSFNNIEIKKEIKDLLLNDGWTYPVINELYEKDTERFHLVFSCEKEEYNTWQKLD